jgi:hypothetical protein
MPDASVEAIRTACERLLNESSFRTGAKRLGDLVAEDAANSPVVDELEAVASAPCVAPVLTDSLIR